MAVVCDDAPYHTTPYRTVVVQYRTVVEKTNRQLETVDEMIEFREDQDLHHCPLFVIATVSECTSKVWRVHHHYYHHHHHHGYCCYSYVPIPIVILLISITQLPT